MRHETSLCRSCSAPIIWAKTSLGKNMPVDATPTPAGNLLLRDDGTVLTLGAAGAGAIGTRHTSHFATCPNAREHRNRARSGRKGQRVMEGRA
jgi:hypothetical protein